MFSLIAVFMSLLISAQIDQGSIMFTGGLGLTSQQPTIETKVGTVTNTIDGAKVTAYGIDLYGGYFFMDNMSAGLNVGFGSYKTVLSTIFGTVETIDTDKTSSFTVAPSLRYYFELDPKLYVFGEFAAGFGSGKLIEESKTGTVTTTNETNFSMFGIGITPGFYYMMTPKVGLQMRFGFLGYQSNVIKTEPVANTVQTITNKDFGLDLDLNTLNFGVVIKL